MRRTGTAVAVVGLLAAWFAVPIAAAASGDEVVTLAIGVTQDIDSPNVTVGFTVSAFEMWVLQYPGLTSRSADDLSITPSLAESWEVSADGLSVTYHLRDGLTWSDGEPLTAEDAAYTINRSRDDAWFNHSTITENLEATVIDPLTVQVTSSVPDPKLPALDIFIVPQHIFEPISADDLPTYDGLDGVGAGPYTLSDRSPDQSWTMVANPSFWGWAGNDPPIDQIVFRVFSNDDAKVAALQQGEIDAAQTLSAGGFGQLEGAGGIVRVEGLQGGFSETAMNVGAGGLGDGHPALQDINVRHAITRAINRDAIFERVFGGFGAVGSSLPVSIDRSWQPDIPADMALGYDPDEANRLLDAAGYADTDGDGRRETPDGDDFVLRYAQRSESVLEPALGTLVAGFLDGVGIGTTVSAYGESQLAEAIGLGEYDLFSWGWTPGIDPDDMLSSFVCAEVTTDPDLIGWNDANWCSEEYDALYEQQKVELDPERRREIVHQMLTIFYVESGYIVLAEEAELQAYRTDRFEGWTQQPAETGPVLFTNTSPTYVNLRPIGEPDPSPDI